MNIFVIPSWYPSEDNPLNGIMIYEQTKALCTKYPDVKIGISVWGQKEEQYLLWSKDHIRNIGKISKASFKPYTRDILPNLREYHKPALTWSNKIMKGNIKATVKANIYNLKAFEADHGRVELIHAQVNHPAGRIAVEVANATKTPYCITERMSPFPCIYSSDKRGNLKPEWLKAYSKSVANVTISPAQKILMEKQGIENIEVIPNFINEDFFKPATSSIPEGPFVFLTLTSAIPRKGLGILLKAIRLFKDDHPDLDVIFRIGGIGDTTIYKLMADTLGIAAGIIWLEQADREHALKEFQNCHAFVLASFEESFGNVYAEAIACGKPVIATKCGGPESIVNNINGILVDRNDASQLARAMASIIHDYTQYDSQVIRQDFLNRFSKRAILPKLYEFYQKTIARHKLHSL